MKLTVDLSGAPRHIREGIKTLQEYAETPGVAVPYNLFTQACRIAEGCTRAADGDPVHASFFGYHDQVVAVGPVELHRPTPAAAVLIQAAGEWPLPVFFRDFPELWELLVQAYCLAYSFDRDSLALAADYRQASRIIPAWALHDLAGCTFGDLAEAISHLQVSGFPVRIEPKDPKAQKKTLRDLLTGLDCAACWPPGAEERRKPGITASRSSAASGSLMRLEERTIRLRLQRLRRSAGLVRTTTG